MDEEELEGAATFGIEILGLELLKHVFQFLGDKDCHRACLTSSFLLTVVDSMERWDKIADVIVERGVHGNVPPKEYSRDVDVPSGSPMARLNRIVQHLQMKARAEESERKIEFFIPNTSSKRLRAWRNSFEKELEVCVESMCVKWSAFDEMCRNSSYSVSIRPLPVVDFAEIRNTRSEKSLGVTGSCTFWLRNKGKALLTIEREDYERLADWGRKVSAGSSPWERWDCCGCGEG